MKNNDQISTGTTPKSPGQMKQIKKTIAKIITVQKEKELSNIKKALEVKKQG